MDRRRFIFVASAIAAGALTENALASALVPAIPTLYGDGIHDDAPALQALVDGAEFHDPRGLVGWRYGAFTLRNKRLLLESTVYLPPGGQLGVIEYCDICTKRVDGPAFVYETGPIANFRWQA